MWIVTSLRRESRVIAEVSKKKEEEEDQFKIPNRRGKRVGFQSSLVVILRLWMTLRATGFFEGLCVAE